MGKAKAVQCKVDNTALYSFIIFIANTPKQLVATCFYILYKV